MLERLEASAWLGFDVPDVVRHELQFEEVLGVIDAVYEYTPAAFTNGATQNEAGQNVGSCKLLGWALLRDLSREEVLRAFGQHYRDLDPEGTSHPNIRAVMEHGLDKVVFASPPLTRR